MGGTTGKQILLSDVPAEIRGIECNDILSWGGGRRFNF